MKDTATQVQLIQCQIEILKALLMCNELVEHEAKWLKNAKTVVRDKTGRFASKAASLKEEAESIVKTGGDILSISSDAISSMVKDTGFRERAGLSASAFMGKAIGNLVAQAKIFPGLEKQVDKFIAEQEKKLQDIYGKDNNALNQAFKKVKLPQPAKDASFKDKLEFQAARYKAYEDTLKNPQHRTNLDDIAAIGKAAVPVAAGLGLNISIDLAASVLLGTPLPLGLLVAASVTSYAASEVASFEAKKFLDKSELTDNQKWVADLAVRILAGATVSGAAHKVAGNVAAKEAEKKAAETAVKKVAEETDVAVKEIKRRTAKLPEGVNKIPLPDATEYAFQVEGHPVKLRVESRGIISSQKASSISFEVDDTFDMNPDLEQRIAKKITLKLRRTFNHIIDQMEEGEIVGCAAHRGDPKREYRVRKFESLGFAKPRGMRDVQLGKVKNGKLEPYYPEGPGFWASPGLKALF